MTSAQRMQFRPNGRLVASVHGNAAPVEVITGKVARFVAGTSLLEFDDVDDVVDFAKRTGAALDPREHLVEAEVEHARNEVRPIRGALAGAKVLPNLLPVRVARGGQEVGRAPAVAHDGEGILEQAGHLAVRTSAERR